MGTNFFFQNFTLSSEQSLIEDLITESIRIYGIDVFYLPRTIVHEDNIFREQEIAKYLKHFQIEMYIKNVNSFAGDGNFLSRFGLEIRDEITFTLAQNVFRKLVKNQNRPNEGDLIWFPLNNKVFQIKFVNHESIFYQLGSLQTYDLTCELFEYSNEVFDTGLTVIDNKYNSLSTISANNHMITPEYDLSNVDNNSQNIVFDDETSDVVDFSTTDPFSEGKY